MAAEDGVAVGHRAFGRHRAAANRTLRAVELKDDTQATLRVAPNKIVYLILLFFSFYCSSTFCCDQRFPTCGTIKGSSDLILNPNVLRCSPYHVLQDGGVGVDGLVSARLAQVEGVVHVGVGGGKPASLQPTEDERKQNQPSAQSRDEALSELATLRW